MKRYILFCSQEYYPSIGMEDFAGMFDTIEEAVFKIQKWVNASRLSGIYLYQIFDTELMKATNLSSDGDLIDMPKDIEWIDVVDQYNLKEEVK